MNEETINWFDVKPLQLVEMDHSKYVYGGMCPPTSVNILRLISELEGSYQLCKYMAFKEDMDTLAEIKSRYYKLYFKLSKEENNATKNPWVNGNALVRQMESS